MRSDVCCLIFRVGGVEDEVTRVTAYDMLFVCVCVT